MTLFCAVIRRDSVSLLSFSFLSHIQVFSWEISFVCRLKYSYSCFLLIFVSWLFYPVDACVIRIISGGCNQSFLHVFFNVIFKSLYRCIDSILNVEESSSFFFSWHYCLSMSFLRCKTLRIVMSFFVPWSICWSSSLVHFKNHPEYLTCGTAQIFIPLMRFLLCCLVLCSFLVLLWYSFLKTFSLMSVW